MPRERDKERKKEEGSEKERRRGWFGRKVGSWDEGKGGWMMAVVLRSFTFASTSLQTCHHVDLRFPRA